MRLSRAWAGLGIALALSALSAPARAHAAYEGSDPDDGATVSSPPSRVTADFTEPVVDDSRLEVYDPCGKRVDNGDSLVAGDRVTVSMAADKQGRYRVHFAVVSSVDGHPTSGDFGFTSSGGAPCPRDEAGDNDGGDGDGDQTRSGTTGERDRSTGRSNATRRTGGDNAASQRAAQSSSSRDRRDAGARRDAASRTNTATGGGDVASDGGGESSAAVSLSDAMNVWEGIPLSGFVAAMLVAAAIGAAGGVIYAGIVGPKR